MKITKKYIPKWDILSKSEKKIFKSWIKKLRQKLQEEIKNKMEVKQNECNSAIREMIQKGMITMPRLKNCGIAEDWCKDNNEK